MIETKCSSYLSTNLILESKCRSLDLKGIWVSCGCTLAVEVYQRKVFRDHNNTRDKMYGLSDQIGQTSWTNQSDWFG
jgi:hypothetical protein